MANDGEGMGTGMASLLLLGVVAVLHGIGKYITNRSFEKGLNGEPPSSTAGWDPDAAKLSRAAYKAGQMQQLINVQKKQ